MGEFWNRVRNTEELQLIENSLNLVPDPESWPDHFVSKENKMAPILLTNLLIETGLNSQKVECLLNEQNLYTVWRNLSGRNRKSN